MSTFRAKGLKSKEALPCVLFHRRPKKMGKGGYGKGWQNRRWQPAHQQWHSSHHDRASWHSQYRQPPRENSLTHLCAGVVTSAFEGVCSGVASATWAAVQGAANTLMNGRSATQAQMPASNGGPADIMKCLAGSGTKPEQPAHPPRETVPTPNANQNQSVAEQMVLNLQEQQLLLQKQLLALQEKQQAVEWQQQQQLRQALKINLARRYLPSQPMKT